jgi:predicted DCC family thiol-disulfide oxidoreductase YuxK
MDPTGERPGRASAAPRGDALPQRVAYYDDACGFCRRWRAALHRADRRHRILFIARRDRAAHRHAVSDTELAASLVVFDATTGRRTQRAQAVAALAQVLPLPYRLLRCLSLPGVASLADRAYDRVARHRGWLSRRFGHDLCELDVGVEGPPPGRDSESVRG